MLLWTAAASLIAAAVVQNRSRKAERDHPPTGDFVTVDGVRLHYVERGRGDPLVLLHGNAMMAMAFLLSDLVDLAAKRYRVIVFDRPGYGWSSRPRGMTVWGPENQARLIQAALDQLGVERPIVLGHSWGALVALAMGLDRPQAVRGLVLESGYYFPTVRPDVPFLSLQAIPLLGDFLRHTFSPLVLRANWSATIRILFAPEPVPDHFRRFPAWMALRPSQHRAASAESALMVPSAARLGRRYGELAMPLAILAGDGDRVAWPDRHGERMARTLPHADYRVFLGRGHMLHHVVPHAVMDAIDAVAAKALRLPEGSPRS